MKLRDTLDEYDYEISLFIKESFKVGDIKDNLDTVIDYISEHYSYDTINYTFFYKSVWPNTQTGADTFDNYDSHLDSNVDRIDIEIENMKKL